MTPQAATKQTPAPQTPPLLLELGEDEKVNPLEKLRELFTQQRPEPGASGDSPNVGLSTSSLAGARVIDGGCVRFEVAWLHLVAI